MLKSVYANIAAVANGIGLAAGLFCLVKLVPEDPAISNGLFAILGLWSLANFIRCIMDLIWTDEFRYNGLAFRRLALIIELFVFFGFLGFLSGLYLTQHHQALQNLGWASFTIIIVVGIFFLLSHYSPMKPRIPFRNPTRPSS